VVARTIASDSRAVRIRSMINERERGPSSAVGQRYMHRNDHHSLLAALCSLLCARCSLLATLVWDDAAECLALVENSPRRFAASPLLGGEGAGTRSEARRCAVISELAADVTVGILQRSSSSISILREGNPST